MKRKIALIALMATSFAACGKSTYGPGPVPKCKSGEQLFLCMARLFPPGVKPAPDATCTELQKYLCVKGGRKEAMTLTYATLRSMEQNNPDWFYSNVEDVVFDCEFAGTGSKPNADTSPLDFIGKKGARDGCASCVADAIAGGCSIAYTECIESEPCAACIDCILAGGNAATCNCGYAAWLANCLGNECSGCTAPSGEGEYPDGWGLMQYCASPGDWPELKTCSFAACDTPGSVASGEECLCNTDCATCACDVNADGTAFVCL